jgi:hypothetical protein
MQSCVGMLEHGNGSEHPLECSQWFLAMLECWNGVEYMLKLTQWCMDMLDIGRIGFTQVDAVGGAGHVRVLKWFGTSASTTAVASEYVRVLEWCGTSN